MVKKILSLYLAAFMMFPLAVYAEEDLPPAEEYDGIRLRVPRGRAGRGGSH